MNIVFTILLILIGVLLFGFAIFIHELGHFVTAKLCKMRVNEFAIGMGPRLISRQRGETKYTLRLFPIGGFCDLSEDDETNPDDKRAFSNKPVWQRLLVLLMGAVMNVLFGFVLMLIVTGTQPAYISTTLGEVDSASLLAESGIEVNDTITSIDGYAIYSIRDIQFQLAMLNPNDVDIVVERGGERILFENAKLSSQQADDGKNTVIIDFKFYQMEKNFGNLMKLSAVDTFSLVRIVIESLVGMVTGRFSFNDMAGPIGAAQIISEAASEGLKTGFGPAVMNIVYMICLITVNLGVVNILPLPALDGGRILFLLFELIFRKPVPKKYEAVVHTVGFVILIGLMVVIAFNDIWRIFGG